MILIYGIIISTYNILFYIISINHLSDYNIKSIVRKIRYINSVFKNYYLNSIPCLKHKCLFNCLVKNITSYSFKPYSQEDIPGKYPYNYPFLENNRCICKNSTDIFISVITPCREFEERMAVRYVYKHIDPSIQLHFFVGYSSEECEIQYEYEKDFFKDISQIPIKESFSNETLFTLYLHKILPSICPYARYYGKMDADQYINFNRLLQLLDSNRKKHNIFYACMTWIYKSINTNQKSKYSSAKNVEKYYLNVFPSTGLPCFTGSFALWSRYLSIALFKESLNENHIIRIDDQHIAWLIYKLNKKNFNITYYNLNCQLLNNLYSNKNIQCISYYKSKYGIHRLKGRVLYSFNKLINK